MIRTVHWRARQHGFAPLSQRRGVSLAFGLLVMLFAGGGGARAQAPDQSGAGQAQQPPADSAQSTRPQTDAATGTTTTIVAPGAHSVEPAPGRRQQREAEDAYLAGAKKLEHDDLSAAEREFQRALKLDPDNKSYAIAISVTRQHRLTELVQQASKARLAGDQEKSDTLLAEARAIDPQSPLVAEHSAAPLIGKAGAVPPSGQVLRKEKTADAVVPALADRSRMLAATIPEPWKIQAPVLAGAVHLVPEIKVNDFHLRGDFADVIRNVASAYGISATVDDSVDRKQVRFDLENVDYDQAMAPLMKMTHTFAVPIDTASVLFAKDDSANRLRLERQLEETILLPGYTTDQINELVQVVKNVFEVAKVTPQIGLGGMVVRAPEDVLEPMNRTISELVDSGGEVMIEAKLYEIDTSRTTNTGATVPTQAGIYNVESAATQLVNENQTLVQQAIAQGLVSSTASNFEIAAALIASGLAKSTLLSSTLGFFGKGLTETGVTESGTVGFNLSLNSSDTRTLDDVQLRVADQQPAVFREGTKYPVTTSTYSTGLSTAASNLSNASINGVSVASLLSQYAGGTTATVPQVTYEDLGVTLEATPVIQKSGRINLKLMLKIEALAGSSANGIPVLESRQFKSDLTVVDGESALLVSSVSRSETAAMTGIPGLSELPGFQTPLDNDIERDTTQLVVVVTPHIVRRRSEMVAGPRIMVHFPIAD